MASCQHVEQSIHMTVYMAYFVGKKCKW